MTHTTQREIQAALPQQANRQQARASASGLDWSTPRSKNLLVGQQETRGPRDRTLWERRAEAQCTRPVIPKEAGKYRNHQLVVTSADSIAEARDLPKKGVTLRLQQDTAQAGATH